VRTLVSYSCKKSKTQTRIKSWWDEECQEAVDYRRKCYKELLKCSSKLQYSHYRKAFNKARNIIKLRKKANFKKFIDELDPNNNPKNFWKVIKLFKNSSLINPIPSSTSKSELVSRFISNFAPSSVTQSFSDNLITKYPSLTWIFI